MNQRMIIYLALITAVVMFLPGCSVVEGIFKAGMWFGFLIVGVILALIIYFVARAKRNK